MDEVHAQGAWKAPKADVTNKRLACCDARLVIIRLTVFSKIFPQTATDYDVVMLVGERHDLVRHHEKPFGGKFWRIPSA